jgi:hypothetical protein
MLSDDLVADAASGGGEGGQPRLQTIESGIKLGLSG